ncbi:MAG: hypothetical protein QXK43_05830 [Candidatus Jordarchaeales archaeon]
MANAANCTYNGGREEGSNKLFNSLKRFKSKLMKALQNSVTMVELCLIDIKGRIVYADKFFSRSVLKSVSNFVKEHSLSLPVGSYVIPSNTAPVILWRVSDSMVLAAQTNSSIAPLITRTPLILRLARRVVKHIKYDAMSELSESQTPVIDEFDVQAWEVFYLKNADGLALGELGDDADLLKVANAIDGKKPVTVISKQTGVPLEKCISIIKMLLEHGVVGRVELCPVIRKINTGKLLFFGIRDEYVRFYRNLKALCDGTRSVKEIADALGINYDNLRYLLSILGEDVTWVRQES